jgi:pimeloyl-ACP methyl ester carboxylesterase
MRVCCLRQVCAKAFLNQNDTLHVAGATLFYRVRGSGPTLLILPGGDGDADTAKTLCDELVDRYTVVTYDRRGLSRSTIDGPVESLTLGTHSDDAHCLLAALTKRACIAAWQQHRRFDWPRPRRPPS